MSAWQAAQCNRCQRPDPQTKRKPPPVARPCPFSHIFNTNELIASAKVKGQIPVSEHFRSDIVALVMRLRIEIKKNIVFSMAASKIAGVME